MQELDSEPIARAILAASCVLRLVPVAAGTAVRGRPGFEGGVLVATIGAVASLIAFVLVVPGQLDFSGVTTASPSAGG